MSGLPNGYGYGYGGGQNLHSQLGNYFNQGSSSDSAGLDADNSLALYLAGSAGLSGSAGGNSATDSYPSYGAAAAFQASAGGSDPYGGQSGHSFDYSSSTTQQQQEALQAADAELYYRQQLQQENLEQHHLELQHLRRQQELHRGYGQHVDAASSLASMWAGGAGNSTSTGPSQGAGISSSLPTASSSAEDLYADLFKRQVQQQEHERMHSQKFEREQEQLLKNQLQQQLETDKKFELQKHEPMILEQQKQQQILEQQKTKQKQQQTLQKKKEKEQGKQPSGDVTTPNPSKRGRGRPRKDKSVKKKDTKEDTDAVAAFMAELAAPKTESASPTPILVAPKKETVAPQNKKKDSDSKKISARELSMTPGAIRARARRAKVKEEKEINAGVISKDLRTGGSIEKPISSPSKKKQKTEQRVAISSPLSNISAPKSLQPPLANDPPKRILPKIHFLSRLAALKNIDVSGPPTVKVNPTIKPKITSKSKDTTLPNQGNALLSQSNGKYRRTFSPKKATPHEFLKSSNPPGVLSLQGKDCLIASTIPPNFPPKLTYRALAAYSLIRSLSTPLRLAPFTPNVFIRSLALPCQNKLLGTIHVNILRFLFAQHNLGVYHHRGDGAPKRTATADSVKDAAVDQFLARKSSPVKFDICGVENITYLDCQTWPLYYDDFVHIMLSSFNKSLNVKDVLLDGRSVAMRGLDSGELEGSKMDEYFKSQPSEFEDELFKRKMEEAESNIKDQKSQVPFYPMHHQTAKPMGYHNMSSYGNIYQANLSLQHGQNPYYYNPAVAHPPLLPNTKKRKDEANNESESKPKRPLISSGVLPIQKSESIVEKTVPTNGTEHKSLSTERNHISDMKTITGFINDGDSSTEEEVDSETENLKVIYEEENTLMEKNLKKNVTSKKVAPKQTEISVKITSKSNETPNKVAPKRPRGRPRKARIDIVPRSTKIESKSGPLLTNENRENAAPRGDESENVMLLKAKKKSSTNISQKSLSRSEMSTNSGRKEDSDLLSASVIKAKEEIDKTPVSTPKTLIGKSFSSVQKSNDVVEKGDNSNSSLSKKSKNMRSPEQNISKNTQKKESYQLKVSTESLKQQKIREMKKRKRLSTPPLPGGVIKSTGIKQMQGNGKRVSSHPPSNLIFNQQYKSYQPNPSSEFSSSSPSLTNHQQYYTPPPPQYYAPNLGSSAQYSSAPRRPAYHLPTNLIPTSYSIGFNTSGTSYNMPQPYSVVRARAVTDAVDQSISEYIVGKNIQDQLGPLYPSVYAFLERKPLDFYNKKAPHGKDVEKVSKVVGPVSIVSKQPPTPTFIKTHESGQSRKDLSIRSEMTSNKDVLPQIKPIKMLRKGKPYHLLPVSMKISILEYLLDELLSLDIISSELSSNQLKNDCSPTTYGAKPNQKQLENITNSDYCSVCSLEGDLLCCDGCSGSYHRRCINIPVGKELPEGKWLCPECQVVEPSKMGPLHGGSKACVDWFVLDDIAGLKNVESSESNPLKGHSMISINPISSGQVNTSGHTSEQNSEPMGRNLGTSSTTMNEQSHPSDKFGTAASKTSNETNLSNDNYDLGRKKNQDCFRILENVEFKVIHGFVFIRDRITKKSIDPSSFKDANVKLENTTLDTTTADIEEEMPLPLEQKQLFELITLLGPDICSRWPFCQIPFDPEKVWKHLELLDISKSDQSVKGQKMTKVKNEISKLLKQDSQEKMDNQPPNESPNVEGFKEKIEPTKCSHEENMLSSLRSMKMAYTKYFEKNDSFNPLIYINNYQRAPFHPSIRAHVGPHFFSLDQTLFDIERFPFRYSMSRDTSRDNNLSLVLKTHESIYDPLKSVREYMLRLEKLLVRSSLINELWGLRNKQLDQNVWSRSVANCRSVRNLAVLLVALIDEVHPRAFFEEWTKLPGHSSSSGSNRGEPRVYFDIGIDFNAEKAIKKRKWDRSSGCDILRLLVSESGGMSEFFNVTDSSLSSKDTKSKRKVAAVGRIDGIVGDKMAAVVALGKKPSNKEPKKTESTTTQGSAESEKKGESDDTSTKSSGRKNSSDINSSDIPPPKRSMTAYMLFLKEKHDEARNNRQEGKIDKFTKKISEMWKSLSPIERTPYMKAARKDKERYLAEKAALKRRKSLELDVNEGRSSASDSAGRRRSREESSRRRVEKGQDRNALHDALDELVIGKNKTTDGRKDLSTESKSLDGVSEKRMKVLRLEQILKEPYVREMHWPLAGRKLFEPDGSLTQRVTKWLGRNAGMKMAPYVIYTNKYEVGLPSVCYMWRKRTLSCLSLEQLILQVRFLESFINKPTINSCETLSRRSMTAKCFIQKEIKCSHVDPSTGTVECLVVNKTKNRGCWMSEDSVDQSALILDRLARFEKKQAFFKEVLVQKTKDEVNEARKIKVEAEKKRADENKKKTEALRIKQAQLAKKRPSTTEVNKVQKEETSLEKRHKASFQKAFERHQLETKRLLKESAARGLPSVPPEVMNPIRMKHMAEMKESNDALRRVSDKGLQDVELTNKLQQAESAGIEMYIREAKQAVKAKSKQTSKKDSKKLSERDANNIQSSKKISKKRKKNDIKGSVLESPKAKVKVKTTSKKVPAKKNLNFPGIEADQTDVDQTDADQIDTETFQRLQLPSPKHQKRSFNTSSLTKKEIPLSVAKKESNKRKSIGSLKSGIDKSGRDISTIEDLSEAIEDGNNSFISTVDGGKFKSSIKEGQSSVNDTLYNGSFNQEEKGSSMQTAFHTDQSHRFNDLESGGFQSSQSQHAAQSYSLRDKFGDKLNYEDASHQMRKERHQQQSLQSQLGSGLGSLTGLGFGGGLSDNHAERYAQSSDYGQSTYRSPMVENSTNNIYGSGADPQPAWLQNMLSSGLTDSIVGEAGQAQKSLASAQNPYYLSDRYDALSNTASLNADAQLYLPRPSPLDVAQSSLLSLGGAGSLDHQQFSQNLPAAQNFLSGSTYDNHQQFGSGTFSRQAAESMGFRSNNSAAYNSGGNRMSAAVSGYGDILEPNPINDVVGDGLYNTGMTGGSSNISNLQSQLLQSHLMGQHQNNQGNSSSSYFENYQHF